jgi:probable F420-dependent oxidoreductase
MLIGAVFPQTEIGSDPAAIRDWAQAAESLGYAHIAAFDHVLGANRATRPGWKGMYDHTHAFHEPLVLFGYLAACTQRIGLATSILVLPQRDAAAAAKQAAEVDVLTRGRLRLGVAAGWNDIEFEALGRSFANRGQRIGEQVEVMRLLWTQELVTFRGKWHNLANVGINPLPVQRPIPVWFGGGADLVLRRVAQSGDGWFANTSARTAAYTGTAPFTPDDAGRDTLRRLHAYARAAGRDPSRIGVEVRIEMVGRSPEQAAADLARWSTVGVTHAQFTTMRAGLKSPADHIAALRRFIEAARPHSR